MLHEDNLFCCQKSWLSSAQCDPLKLEDFSSCPFRVIHPFQYSCSTLTGKAVAHWKRNKWLTRAMRYFPQMFSDMRISSVNQLGPSIAHKKWMLVCQKRLPQFLEAMNMNPGRDMAPLFCSRTRQKKTDRFNSITAERRKDCHKSYFC